MHWYTNLYKFIYIIFYHDASLIINHYCFSWIQLPPSTCGVLHKGGLGMTLPFFPRSSQLMWLGRRGRLNVKVIHVVFNGWHLHAIWDCHGANLLVDCTRLTCIYLGVTVRMSNVKLLYNLLNNIQSTTLPFPIPLPEFGRKRST